MPGVRIIWTRIARRHITVDEMPNMSRVAPCPFPALLPNFALAQNWINKPYWHRTAWITSLLPQLKADGRLYLLEDDEQRLYDREPFDISDAVTVTCRDNYRSPQAICQAINALSLTERSVISRNPYRGEVPDFHGYDSGIGVVQQTANVFEQLLGRGFVIEDIVVLTGLGRARSTLLNAGKIGRFRTKRFSGKFSKNADPIWTDGDLLVESVYRFKGQSAPAVVLSEVQFDELSILERRKLFVGLTRGQMAAELVISPAAEKCLSVLL